MKFLQKRLPEKMIFVFLRDLLPQISCKERLFKELRVKFVILENICFRIIFQKFVIERVGTLILHWNLLLSD